MGPKTSGTVVLEDLRLKSCIWMAGDILTGSWRIDGGKGFRKWPGNLRIMCLLLKYFLMGKSLQWMLFWSTKMSPILRMSKELLELKIRPKSWSKVSQRMKSATILQNTWRKILSSDISYKTLRYFLLPWNWSITHKGNVLTQRERRRSCVDFWQEGT